MDEGWESVGLPTLYERAVECCRELEERYEEEGLNKGVAVLEECERRVSSLALFSWNEEPEDLETPSIKYLLVQYYLGRIQSLRRSASREARRDALLQAKCSFGLFVERCKAYRLLEDETLRLSAPIHDTQQIRTVKIARLRRTTLLEGAISAGAPAAGSRRQHTEGEEEQEEEGRAYWLAKIQLAAIDSASQLESIEREVAILAVDRTVAAEAPKSAARGITAGRPVAAVTTPFVLVKDRAEAARNVFRPGHTLPTMTIDEYLEVERRRNGILVPAGTPAERPASGNEDEEARADRALQEARRSDLFRDENPHGWGNTYNLS